MARKDFQEMNCSLARALDVVGDWWTMLVVRELFLGVGRFDEIQRNLGIARNILSARLRKLEATGLIERKPMRDGARRLAYHLTPKGADFLPVMVSLAQWGDRWACPSQGRPAIMVEVATGREVPPMTLRSTDGRTLGASEVMMVPGPGAAPETTEKLERLKRIRQDDQTVGA